MLKTLSMLVQEPRTDTVLWTERTWCQLHTCAGIEQQPANSNYLMACVNRDDFLYIETTAERWWSFF